MTEQKQHITLSTREQKRINFVQYRLTPYFVILLFTFAMSIVRGYLIPEWGIGRHILAFVMQTVGMTCVWQLVKAISKRLDKYMPFEHGPVKRIVVQLLICILILGPVVIIGIYYGKPYMPVYVNKQFLTIAAVLFVILISLFNFSFYAGYFFKNWQESVMEKASLEVEAAELQKEKSTMQYHQLRNQVNPHYLFNTLTSLDGLIHTNPDLASEFVRHMAKVYRYVLRHTENEVVNLDEELEFIQHYIQLLQIRYAKGINIEMKISPAAKDKGIVMVTLQMLIDNAIKHNIVQENEPLHITIKDEDDYIVIHNNKQLRKQIESSNGQGLIQLKELYGYLTDKPMVIEETPDNYTIKLPLL
ncbi:MAG: histidine kinase [Bacteroidetes bacterium]|nr:histidine kinase [Bacteroidota bacterium]